MADRMDAGGQTIAVRKDLRVPMRDGVELAADAYHGIEDKPRPALVALSPYGKELQALALTMPPQRRPSPMWDGCIEAGDIARVVEEDYVHVIGDLRGSGALRAASTSATTTPAACSLGQDAYDFIEWVAEQPWCDGNVGMIGISYFGSMQVLAAAERPPHLKAIFVSGGHYDFYETTYHGGIMWFMPRAAREGRGGDSGWAFTDRVKSRMLEKYSPEEIEKRVAERLQDPDVAAWPNLVHVLNYPKNHEAWFDIVMNELDGDWYEERNPITLAPNIDIPVYLQIDQGRGWTLDGTIELFNALKGPKKLDIGPYPPMQSRPFIEEHDKMFRWYDYWIKGIDNGVMDEPAVSVFVEGSREVVTADAWPPKDVEYRSLYLRPRAQAVHRARADGRRVRRPGRLLPGAADGDRQGGDPQLEHPAVRGGHRDDRHRRRAPLRRDRPAGHQLHPAPVGRRPERQAPADHHRLPQGLAPRARRAHHRGQPVPPAHPRRAGGAGDDRGVRAAPLPVREHVPARPPPGGGAVQRRAAGRRAQRAAAAGRLPPAGGPARHPQDLPRRRPPVPAGAAVHDPDSAGGRAEMTRA